MKKECCKTGDELLVSGKGPVIAVIGNPNCGKSTLFNAITGIKQKVGNWPGVTVERREGRAKVKGREIVLVDLPGVYSLDSDREALDEKVARNYILSGEADLLLIVADAANLERSLYLIDQLLESGIPAVLALNMVDVAESRGMQVDSQLLSDTLGCPVVSIVARKGKGLDNLLGALSSTLEQPQWDSFRMEYAENIERALDRLIASMETTGARQLFAPRWQALQCLEEYFPSAATASFENECREVISEIKAETGEDADSLIAASRYEFAHQIATTVITQANVRGQTWSDRVDRVVLNKYLGMPFFLMVIYLMFSITVNFGGALVDFFDIAVGALLIDGTKVLLTDAGFPSWFQVLLADGLGGGIQVVATFIPIIALLYFCLSILEDSGYMARAAFVMDRLMRKLGLPGKAFVPLIVGFGCNVPSIMATRTLEKQRDRILTVMMAPFMSCGARLSVYALFAAAFFPHSGQNIVFLLYLVGIGAAIFTALLLKNSLLQGESDGFMIELPPYHPPALKSLFVHTWERLKGFVVEAGKFIVVMVMVINVLNSTGMDGSFGNENSSNSVLSEVSKSITPLFSPMGIEEENWPAVVGIFSGILAKEVVVGTLDAVYTNLENSGSEEPEDFNLKAKWTEAVTTTKENLVEAFQNFGDPLGLRVLDEGGDIGSAAEEQEVSASLFGTLVKYFDGKIGAFSYLLFILLYVPCVAALAAVKRETGSRWMLFSASWSLYLAFSLAVGFYQMAYFSLHPLQSLSWVGLFVFGYFLIWLLLRRVGSDYLRIDQAVQSGA